MNSTTAGPKLTCRAVPKQCGQFTRLRKFSRRILISATLPLLATVAYSAHPVITDPSDIDAGCVDFMTDTDVLFQIQASGNPTSYGATGLPAGLSINSQTGIIDGSINSAGIYPVTLSASNGNGTGNFPVNFFVYERLPSPLPIAAADPDLEKGVDVDGFDEDQVTFTQDPSNHPDHFFYKLPSPTSQGGDAIRNRANLPLNSQTGVLALVRGPAQITFNWYANIENGYHFFSFFVDGSFVTSITGTTIPADVVYDLGPGLHRLQWNYYRDFADFGGADLCILDNLRVTGYPAWADDKKLTIFESYLNIDKEPDGNSLYVEYALDLNPKNKEMVAPLITYEPDGRAILEIERNEDAIGVTVNIEKMNLANPGTWSTALESLVDTDSLVRKREFSPQDKGIYRATITSP